MEETRAADNAADRHTGEMRGKSLDGRNLATASYDASWEKNALKMQLYMGSKKPFQRPDGSFPFTLGYDALGDAGL